jgi:hypothetical protein
LRRIVGGRIARAIGQKCARLAADQKDLIRKSAVIGRDNRYTELFKALAQIAAPPKAPSTLIVHCGNNGLQCENFKRAQSRQKSLNRVDASVVQSAALLID